jgi:hypothetical protein
VGNIPGLERVTDLGAGACEMDLPCMQFATTIMKPAELCPITGRRGYERRRLSTTEIVNLYAKWFNITVSRSLQEKYFAHDLVEFECKTSGLRWYEPAKMGESDYYEVLESLPWYYNSLGWDKLKAMEILRQRHVRTFFEPGCGDGFFIRACQKVGLSGFGSEINQHAIAVGRGKGLNIYDANQMPSVLPAHEAIVALQTLEHMRDPIGFLREIMSISTAKVLIVAVPCYETLLGLTSDPLSWPPHHHTAWSRRGMKSLATTLNIRLESVHYDQIGPREFVNNIRREAREQFSAFPFARGRIGGVGLYAVGRLLGRRGARSGHSILGVFVRQ